MRRPLLVGLLFAAPLPLAGQPALNLPPEVRAHLPRDLRPYFVAFLVAPALARPVTPDLFIRHQDYVRGQVEAGVYHLVGPLTDDGHIRGMVILSAASAEAARAIVAAVPLVQSGVTEVEVHPAVFPSLAGLRIDYPPR